MSKFDIYRNNTLQEKLFVHTDQSFYLTGEILWLKIYYVDASLHRPLNISKVAYVEIIDAEKKAVIQTKIALLDGNGSGSIFLPSSLVSGHYLLRAYTNWMKNFSVELYFQQPLTILNPFTKLGLKPIKEEPEYDVQFFPEGGILVDGLESKVAFRVVDQSGKGIQFKGSIVDEHNDTIVNFRPLKFGMGNFMLKPSSTHVYKAIIKDEKARSIAYSIPAVHHEGYVIHVSDTASSKIKVTVKAQFANADQNPSIYLFAHARQMVVIRKMDFLRGGRVASFILDKADFADGINHITIFNSEMLPVCERLYFKQPAKKLKIDVLSDQSQYATRREVDLSFYTHVEDKPVTTNMSVSVYRIDSTKKTQQGINHYLLLTSDLSGNIESPDYYFDPNPDEIKTEAIENLMLTHGWSRFKWEDVFKSKSNFEFPPEMGGHIVKGQVTENVSGTPVKDIITFLSTPEKNIRLYLSRSREEGKVQFEMQNFYGNKELIIQTNTAKDSTYQFKIFSPFSEKKSNHSLPVFDLSENLKDDMLQQSIHMQVQNTFYRNKINRFVKPSVDSIPFYGSPDEKYLLDDFTRFPTMEEVMREYVPGVLVRKHQGKFHFLTLDTPNKSIFKENPLVLLDGLPIFDIDKIMNFDPRNVKKLEVMTRKYYLGILSFDGVVSYTTYKGDLGNFKPDTKSLIINYEGLQLQREFFSPRYETQQLRESTLPDARTLLYWSPTVTTDKSGKSKVVFYTSDVAGKYAVVVQGITKQGESASSTIVLDVKDTTGY